MYETDIAERYVQALLKEISSWNVLSNPVGADSIYFGGGTPSLLSIDQLERLLTAIHSRFEILPNAEITIEMNPGDAEGRDDKLAGWRRLNFNRVSFGAQTFDDRELARLGRSHTTEDTTNTFQLLRDAGFDNVSFDLIAGLPGQTVSGWQYTLHRAFALRPEHLSFYLLEVHEGTPLAEHIRKGIQPHPDDELAAEMYELMLERANASGYEHYEISNLCLPGYESRHNTKYWIGVPYYGFGCSAHSFDGKDRRWSNERDVARYVELIEQQENPIVEQVKLTPDEVRAEAVFLGMRMMRGVSVKKYQRMFGVDLRTEHRTDLERFRDAGLIEFDGDLLRLTSSGALLSNEVFSAFV